MRRSVALAVVVLSVVSACTDDAPAPPPSAVEVELDSVPPITVAPDPDRCIGTATDDDVVLLDGTVVTLSVVDLDVDVDVRCAAAAGRRVVETQIAAVPGTPREIRFEEPVVTDLAIGGTIAFQVEVPVTIDGLDTVTYVDVIAIERRGALTILTARHPTTPPSAEELASLVARVGV